MEVIHYASGDYYVQIVYNNTGSWRRRCDSGTWSSWVQDILTDTTYSTATTSAAGLMSSADKTKLNNIAAGAQVNVQSNWNATSGDASILNRPTLGTAAAKNFVTTISGTTSNGLVTDSAVKDYIGTLDFGVQSVGLKMPTGFTVTSSPITENGSINVTMTTGYAIPLNASLDNFELAYVAKHSHTNAAIINGLTDTSISNWNTAFSWGNHANAGYAQQNYVQDVSTRLAVTNTNVSNVSTYVANVSTNLSTTNTKVNNVSTYAANVSTNLAAFKNDVSINELAWAAAWNQLFALNPSLVRPSNTQYQV